MARTSREHCEYIETLFVPVDDGTAIAPPNYSAMARQGASAIVVPPGRSVIEAAVSSLMGLSSANSHASMTMSNTQHHLPLAPNPKLYRLPSVSSASSLASVVRYLSSVYNLECTLVGTAGRDA